MAEGFVITVSGNLVDDPELRYTPTGQAVASLTIAVNSRKFDKNSGEWKEGATSFVRCNIWRDMAENCAEALRKGDRVVATGNFSQRSYEIRDGEHKGEKRTIWEMLVQDIGPSLRFATAEVKKGG